MLSFFITSYMKAMKRDYIYNSRVPGIYKSFFYLIAIYRHFSNIYIDIFCLHRIPWFPLKDMSFIIMDINVKRVSKHSCEYVYKYHLFALELFIYILGCHRTCYSKRYTHKQLSDKIMKLMDCVILFEFPLPSMVLFRVFDINRINFFNFFSTHVLLCVKYSVYLNKKKLLTGIKNNIFCAWIQFFLCHGIWNMGGYST